MDGAKLEDAFTNDEQACGRFAFNEVAISPQINDSGDDMEPLEFDDPDKL